MVNRIGPLLVPLLVANTVVGQAGGAAPRETSLDAGWRFHRGDDPFVVTREGGCSFQSTAGDRPVCAATRQRTDPSPYAALTPATCASACCRDSASCTHWQFCPRNASCAGDDTGIPGVGMAGCWIGSRNTSNSNPNDPGASATATRCANPEHGWLSGIRAAPAPASASPYCTDRQFCGVGFADAAWRTVDVPHDYSIEDLPPRVDAAAGADAGIPSLISVRYNSWLFNKGDDPSWSNTSYNDVLWQRVTGGEDWRKHSNYTKANATGWYRQVSSAFFRACVCACVCACVRACVCVCVGAPPYPPPSCPISSSFPPVSSSFQFPFDFLSFSLQISVTQQSVYTCHERLQLCSTTTSNCVCVYSIFNTFRAVLINTSRGNADSEGPPDSIPVTTGNILILAKAHRQLSNHRS